MIQREHSWYTSYIDITIKQCKYADGVYKIAKNHLDYSNKSSPKSIKKDTKVHILCDVYINNKIVGFTIFKELNPEVIKGDLGILSGYQCKNIGSQPIAKSPKNWGKNSMLV